MTSPERNTRAQREKVIFEVNAPRAVTIERDPPDYPTEGNWGPQWMYFLADNQIMFVEPDVHEQLIQEGAAHGKTFTITKTKDGRKNKWIVIRGDVEAQAARAIRAPAPAPRPEAPAPRPAQRAEAPAPAPEPAPERTQRQHVSGNVMKRLSAARSTPRTAQKNTRSPSGQLTRASSEDVRALAITIYIEVTGSGGGRKR